MAEEKRPTVRGSHLNNRAALEAHQFQPGRSGNPRGRPKAALKRLEMAEHGNELRRVLVKIVGRTFMDRVEVDVSYGSPVAIRSRPKTF